MILKAWLAKRPVAWVAMSFVALAVFVNIIVFSVTEGMQQSFVKQITSRFPDLTVTHYDAGIYEDDRWEEEHFREALGQIEIPGEIVFELKTAGLALSGETGLSQGALFRGVTQAGFNRVFPNSSATEDDIDRLFSTETGKVPLIVSSRIARTLRVEKGDTVKLLAYVPAPISAIGSQPQKKELLATVKMSLEFNSIEDQYSVFLPLINMQRFMNRYGYEGEDREISVAHIKCHQSSDISSLKDELNKVFKENQDEFGFFYARSPLQGQRMLQQIYNEMTMVRVIVMFVILLAACAVFLMIHLLMKSKIKTLGLLMAMGVSRLRLFRMVIAYGLFLSVLGSVGGWAGGYCFMDNIEALHSWLIVDVLSVKGGLFGIYNFDSFPSAYSHRLGLSLMLGCTFLCTLAAFFPAWFSSRLPCAEVLKNE